LDALMTCTVVVKVNQILSLETRVVVGFKGSRCIIRGLIGNGEHAKVKSFYVALSEKSKPVTNSSVEVGRFGWLG
jgi:hypothetical protein